jgi:glycosyltransferase involved in cell wall biosynthesis
MEKLASIVVCTYNGERYLQEQLNSLLIQTHKPLEIIISDDGSSDSTRQVIEDFRSAHAGLVKVLENKINKGLNHNFMNAFKYTSGEYIFPCDQDDIWKEDKVERLISEIGVRDMIYTDSILVTETLEDMGQKRSGIVNMVTESELIYFLFCNCVAGHSLMFKRSLLDVMYPYDSHVPNDLWITWAALCQNGIKYLDWGSVYYRQHNSNVSDPLKKRDSCKKRDSIMKNQGRVKWLKILRDSSFISTQDKAMVEGLIELYEKRFDNIFLDKKMFNFHYENRNKIYYSLKKSPGKILRNIIKESLGLKHKALMRKFF